MKAFIVLMLLVITFLLFANGAFKGLDLTPASASSGAASSAAAAPAQSNQVAPQVITIQQSPAPAQSSNTIPVTGACTNPYTVQPGDSLMQIAINCNTTLAAIRQANPQVTDANLIYPGQQLNIPGAGTAAQAQQTVVVPVTGDETSAASPAASQALPTQTPVPLIVTPTAAVSTTGLYPTIAAGTGMLVQAIGYPANAAVNVAIGPQNQGYTVVASGVTDASGNFTTRVTVPQAQNAQTPYVVVVATTGSAPVQAMSRPFYVGPAASPAP